MVLKLLLSFVCSARSVSLTRVNDCDGILGMQGGSYFVLSAFQYIHQEKDSGAAHQQQPDFVYLARGHIYHVVGNVH